MLRLSCLPRLLRAESICLPPRHKQEINLLIQPSPSLFLQFLRTEDLKSSYTTIAGSVRELPYRYLKSSPYFGWTELLVALAMLLVWEISTLGVQGLSAPATPYHHGGHGGDYKNIEALSSAKPSGGFESEYTVKDSSAYDFLWTIKSFSKIAVDNESKQASGRFQSNGYSWKLILYPNGDIVNGQISLYLMLSKSSTHTLEAVFKVSYVLFLFDQNTGGALSRKGENHGQVKDKMGFRSMIDLKTFKKSSNGYLVEDNCMFGVKILQIIPIHTPSECIYPVKKVNHEHSWKIENFSKLDKKTMHEMKFTAGDYLWSVRIHPEGDQKSDIKVNDGNVSLYMSYSGSIHDTSAMKVSVEFSLSIIDQINGTHKKRTYTEVFKCSQPGWGWRDFMPLKDFNDSALGFIVNDTCIIVAQVVVLALVK